MAARRALLVLLLSLAAYEYLVHGDQHVGEPDVAQLLTQGERLLQDRQYREAARVFGAAIGAFGSEANTAWGRWVWGRGDRRVVVGVGGTRWKRMSRQRREVSDGSVDVDLDPNHIHAYTHRAIAAAALNDLRGAVRDLTRALEIDPSSQQVGRPPGTGGHPAVLTWRACALLHCIALRCVAVAVALGG